MASMRWLVVACACAWLVGTGCSSGGGNEREDTGEPTWDTTGPGDDTVAPGRDALPADLADDRTGTDVEEAGGDDVAPGRDTVETPDATEDTATPDQVGDAVTPDVVAPTVFWLTLLHSSDTESAMLPGDGFGGVAYFATLLKDLKAEAAAFQPPIAAGDVAATGTVVVSAGDNFLPGLNFKASLENGVPFYETVVLQDLGYDAIGLGNHDFDFGPATLADFMRGFTTPVTFVGANLDVSADAALQQQATAGRFAKSTVVTVGGEKIGVVGAITEELPYLSMLGDVQVTPAVAAIQAEVDELTGAGVNKIVLLSHLQAVGNDKKVVPLLHDVDIVVSGGGHEVPTSTAGVLVPSEKTSGVYPEMVTDADGVAVPIVVAGSLYRYVGRLVAKFDATGHLVTVDEALSGPIRVANKDVPDAVTADATLQAAVVAPLQDATNQAKATVIGDSDVALDGLRANVRTMETNEGDLVADALLWQGKLLASASGVPAPVVGLQNGGGIRNNSVLPAGSLSLYDTFAMLPFSNHEAIVPNVSRDMFKALLENAVSKVEVVDGRFLQIAGFRYTWDGSQPARTLDASGAVTAAGSRVRSVTLDDGTVLVADGVVVPGAPLTIATIDYEANGGDQSPYDGVPFTIIDATYQAALEDYIVVGLGGHVLAADYPVGGTGRITALNACGNGLVEGSEGCDDHNLAASDGCSATCTVEDGFTCSGSPSVCSLPGACAPAVVLSQVYGGGGNANATFTNDYVELHNRAAASADVSGWSIQYASATGTTWKANVLPDGTTIAGGGYLLVQLASNGSVGAALPSPLVDLSAGSNMSQTNGKVALVADDTELTGCPAAGTVVDLVAFGTGTCGEGGGATEALSSTKAALRNGGGATPGTGCDDTDANAADFTVGTPAPRTAASTPATCSCQP
jgi:5'-nucleotidase